MSNDDVLFSEVFVTVAQMMHRGLKQDELGVSGLNALILMTVYTTPNITMSELATNVGISRAQLSRMIGNLEQDGFIKRHHNEANRRIVNVQQTQAGDALVQKHIQLSIETIQQRLNKLEPEDHQALVMHLNGIYQLLKKAEVIGQGTDQQTGS